MAKKVKASSKRTKPVSKGASVKGKGGTAPKARTAPAKAKKVAAKPAPKKKAAPKAAAKKKASAAKPVRKAAAKAAMKKKAAPKAAVKKKAAPKPAPKKKAAPAKPLRKATTRKKGGPKPAPRKKAQAAKAQRKAAPKAALKKKATTAKPVRKTAPKAIPKKKAMRPAPAKAVGGRNQAAATKPSGPTKAGKASQPKVQPKAAPLKAAPVAKVQAQAPAPKAAAPAPAPAPPPAPKPRPKGGKERFQIEFLVRSAPSVLYELISTPSGFAEWYCDDVDVRGEEYTFRWQDESESALLIGRKLGDVIRFRRMEEEDPEAYFEFRVRVDAMTNEVALIVTDHAWPREVEQARNLWNSQIANLLRVLGA